MDCRSGGPADDFHPAGRGTTAPSTFPRGRSSTRSTTCSPPRTRSSTKAGSAGLCQVVQCCQRCCKPKIYHHTIHIYILLSTVRLITLGVGLPRLKQLFGGGPSFIPEFTALTISYQNVTSSVEQRLVKIQWCTNIFTEEVPRLHSVVAIITHEINVSVYNVKFIQ